MTKHEEEIGSGFRAATYWWIAFAFLLIANSTLHAQVKPNSHWRTIRTEHFYVHFTPELEEAARRAATHAESAYAELAKHLTMPRGKIDLLISDDVDFSNGYATPFPSNRIVVYANPPVSEGALRFTDDFLDLVITHELTHIFHLDRVGGIWRVLQSVFGRAPFLFVNAYQPRWLVEGLAVYYESLITESGRIEGSEHRMIVSTAALEHRFPRLDQLSSATPHFPYGYAAYAYGSLFMDYLGRTHGDSAMRTFIDVSSSRLLPWSLNGASRRAFGAALTAEYRAWTDSLVKNAPPATPPIPGWRGLTVDGVYANFPRWLNDTTLVYTGTPGRETYGAYKLTLRSSALGPQTRVTRDRIARRHSRSPNTVLSDGSLLYSQHEYTSPYTFRSDLYVDRARGGTQRLTHGARLSMPDARADGLIAAVQIVAGGTRVALVSSDGQRVLPITNGGLDEQWAEPRWSPDGRHLAVVRWLRGGTSEVAVIDTTGRIVQSLIRERTVNSTPSWSPDGRVVYFTSDRTGIANLYQAAFRFAFPDSVGVPGLQQVSNTQTGLFEAQASPAGREMAAVWFKSDGYHVGIAPIDSLRAESATAIESVAPRDPAALTPFSGTASKYSAWRTLRPTYWIPFFEAALDSNSVRYGAMISGADIADRHAYQALLFVPSDNSGLTGSLYYKNAMLGQPLLELYSSQEWDNIGCVLDSAQQNRCVGDLRRRIRSATLALTFLRPRARTFSYFSAGAGAEIRDYATDSTSLILRIDSLYRRTYYYPRLTFSTGWSNTQYPPLAISQEDGLALALTSRHRWRSGDSATLTTSVVGSGSAYKSLDLPGYAHHVLALNLAAGVQDSRATSYFEVGGVSGGVLDVLPGYVLGEGRRNFGVRGFEAGSLLGIRAVKGTLEYRAPLTIPGRGLGTLPLFLDRTSLTVFGDAGSAWCPGIFTTRPAPSNSRCTVAEVDAGVVHTKANVIASAGAELNVSAAVLNWDIPYRFRLGFAVPVAGTEFGPNRRASVYFTVGVPF